MIKKNLRKLSKNISRKNLTKYIDQYIKIIDDENDGLSKLKVLNIGSGGDIEKYLIEKFKFVKSIDIDQSRNPDQVIDICNKKELEKLTFRPDLICIFEVLEHTENPVSAVSNIFTILDNGGYVLFSSPFIFHIHDEPYDFYRFTKYGLKHLFRDFAKVEILSRNGWFETILVLFMRLRLEKSLVGKIIGNSFIFLYYLLTPVTWFLQKTITSDKMTTGYFLYAKK